MNTEHFLHLRKSLETEGHYIITEEPIHQDGIAIPNAPNNKAAKYVKQNLIKLKGKRQIHNYCWKFQCPSLNNQEKNWTENHQEQRTQKHHNFRF